MNPKFKELAETIKLMDELSKKKDQLRTELLEEVQKENGKVENDYGVFKEVLTKVWTYPKYIMEKEISAKKKVEAIMKDLEIVKETSRSLGKSTFTTISSLRFTPRKEND